MNWKECAGADSGMALSSVKGAGSEKAWTATATVRSAWHFFGNFCCAKVLP
jgi:hypothetical protein